MKLIFCPQCRDIVALHRQLRTCLCGRAYGQYVDEVNAIYGGGAVPLGIANASLAHALQHRPESGRGVRFEAFVIPKRCPSMYEHQG